MKKSMEEPVFYTPETIAGACLSGKNMTSAQLKQTQLALVKRRLARNAKKVKLPVKNVTD